MVKKFKLQSVLDYRQILEAEARQRLTASIEREQAVCRQFAESRDRFARLCSDLEVQQQKGIAIADFMLHQSRIQGAEMRLKSLEQELERCRQEVAVQRQGLCAAGRDKKLLERLKEKFGEEWKQHQRRQETILLDEISLNNGKGDL